MLQEGCSRREGKEEESPGSCREWLRRVVRYTEQSPVPALTAPKL